MSQTDDCKHSDYKLCFKLKQHTPIIHFQVKNNNKDWTTIKGSEVKPKFDRYIIENHFTGVKDKENFEKYLVNKDTLAFNYKIRIEEINETAPFVYESEFLGNMDNKKEKLNEKFSNGLIVITMSTFNTELLSILKNYFSNFLLETNFGARTSKGYGSYYLFDETNNTYVEPNFSFLDKRIYTFKTTKDKCIQDIDLLNKFFRSGINFPCGTYSKKDKEHNAFHKQGNLKEGCPKRITDQKGTRIYIKSALYTYLNEKTDISWDKKKIKYYFSSENIKDDKKATLARDLFGLSSRQEWGKAHGNMVIIKSNKDITRFQSPIIFKSLITNDIPSKATSEVVVKFWANDSYQKLLGKTFNVKLEDNSKTSQNMHTPNEFSFQDFFDYLATEYEVNIDQIYSNQDEAIRINRMLSDIKKGYLND